MKLVIIIFILILLFDIIIFLDTNNIKRIYYKEKNNGPKITIIGSLHGNEPAGSVAINDIIKNINNNNIKIKKGELVFYPFVNKYGYYLNIRNIPSLFNYVDLNRIWYNNKSSNFSCIEKIKKDIENSDLVIDCHEGWGYHINNKKSMGSCLFTTHEHLIPLCNKIVNILNKDILDNKKFISRGITTDLMNKSSLKAYCFNNNIPNILVETTGQNNIQPLYIRKNQYKIILLEIFKNYKII